MHPMIMSQLSAPEQKKPNMYCVNSCTCGTEKNKGVTLGLRMSLFV